MIPEPESPGQIVELLSGLAAQNTGRTGEHRVQGLTVSLRNLYLSQSVFPELLGKLYPFSEQAIQLFILIVVVCRCNAYLFCGPVFPYPENCRSVPSEQFRPAKKSIFLILLEVNGDLSLTNAMS